MSSLPRENQLKWESAIAKLREWAETMPSECLRAESCQQAVVFAELLSQDGQPYPTRVGITNDLGIALEWSSASDSVHMEIIDARYAELTEFRGTELVADEDLVWDNRRQVYMAK
tara:strand:+ start:853 stop:1197 length:345 start_codon:yes stop_codon:yes gene_type:complete